MTYEFYKILHILGLTLTLFGLFGLSSVLWNEATPQAGLRKIWSISHGIGLLMLLVAGFGLAARLGLARQLPSWIYFKLFIWVLLGAMPALIKRQPQKSGLWTLVVFILVLLAVIFAIKKPF